MEKLFSLELFVRGKDTDGEGRSYNKDFSIMTFQSLDVVVVGGRMWQKSQKCEVGKNKTKMTTTNKQTTVAMNSGNTGSPQVKFSFLYPLDMAASMENWPMPTGLIDQECPRFMPFSCSGQTLSLLSLKGSRWYILSVTKDIINFFHTNHNTLFYVPTSIFLSIHFGLLRMHSSLYCRNIYRVATMCHRLN